MATFISINDQMPAVYPNKNILVYMSNEEIYADAVVDRTSSTDVNIVTLSLVRLRKSGDSKPQMKWYWGVRPYSLSSSTAKGSFNITDILRQNPGYTFQIGCGTSPYTQTFTADTTPHGTVYNSSLVYQFVIEFENPYGNFETEMIYPAIENTRFMGTPRKLLFHLYIYRPITLRDIIVEYDIGNVHHEFSCLTRGDLFELRAPNPWRNFTLNSTLDYEGIYVAFSAPDEGGNRISNINITAKANVEGPGTISQDLTTPSFKSIKDDIHVSKGERITKTQRDILVSAVNLFNDAYAKTCSTFALGTPPKFEFSDFVEHMPTKAQLIWYQTMFDASAGLPYIFPKSFKPSDILNNMYLPSSGELIEANADTPSSNPNGNFYNNLVWVLENLL